jgi:hypothetical protein
MYFSGVPRMLLIALLMSCASLVSPLAASPRQPASRSHEKAYALIFGTVWGPDNHPLYAVKVKLRREDQKKFKWEQYSDHRGEFAFRVPAGKATYYVIPDLKGYKLPDGSKLQAGEEVKVEIENDERSDIGLHLK